MSSLQDFMQSMSNSAASNVSAPVDGINWLLRKTGLPVSDAPFMGSDWMEQKGFTKPVQQGAASVLGETAGMIAPFAVAAKAPQLARALNDGVDAMAPKVGQMLEDYMTKNGMQLNAVHGGKYGPALDAKYGDKLDAFLGDSKDGVTTLSKIVVPKDQRGKGVGTAFMQDLTKMADKDGVTLALSPSDDFGGSVKRLNEFYRGQGFVPNRGRFKDFAISESMLRPPGYQIPKEISQTKTFSGSGDFFDAVGVAKQDVKADVGNLFVKHPEFFKNPNSASDHVAHGLLSEPLLVTQASDPRFTLTVQDAKNLPVPGGDDTYRSLVTNFGGKQGYQVRSAQGMDEAQVAAKKLKAKK